MLLAAIRASSATLERARRNRGTSVLERATNRTCVSVRDVTVERNAIGYDQRFASDLTRYP
jgi:hypothetical protein